jgi:alpha-L-fucosidase
MPIPARFLTIPLLALALAARATAADAPAPYGPVPTQDQLHWQKMEQYALICIGLNTFTGNEWGYGNEDPKIFNPAKFDAEKIAETFQKSGLKAIILVAKHHDGFCLWPSKYTERSVKNSPYKNGKGDIVREFADACKHHGLKFGIYLSPWDRNQPTYGKPEYITYFRNQLKELLTNYGPIFEIWFDGANGGDGFYGGAKEMRHIDRLTYYDWANTWKMARELQPNVIVWAPIDCTPTPPDVRWGGNENGIAPETNESVVTELAGGVKGAWWIPTESNVSIRFGWFYHADQDLMVKTPAKLVQLYFYSVGRNSTFLLNVPPRPDGLIDPHDVDSLLGWKVLLDRIFAKDVAQGATATASNTRGDDARFAPGNVLRGADDAYWATDDAVTTPDLTLRFAQPTTFNVVDLGEYIALGQRVQGFTVEAFVKGAWKEIAKATTIGHRRLLAIPRDVTTDQVRLHITQSDAAPVLSHFRLYEAPLPILEEAGLRAR